MNPFTTQLLYTLEMALLFSIVTIGIYLSFRLLRFPDLTSEGGFGISALVGGLVSIKTASPWLGMAAGVLTGALTGAVTAILANSVRLPTILASILTMTMSLSGGLLLVGKPNAALPSSWVLQDMLGLLGSPLAVGIIGLGVVLACLIAGLYVFLMTGAGNIMRVRGENPSLCQELGHSLLIWDVAGLSLANGMVGLAAVLLSQRSGYASISMGRGVAISAIAAIMLSEILFPTKRVVIAIAACFGGTLILQLVRLAALNMGIPDGGLDLVTSLMLIAVCLFADWKKNGRPLLLEQIRM